MRTHTIAVGILALLLPACLVAADEPKFALFRLIESDNPPKLIAYTPNGLDPRNPGNQIAHKTSALRADLTALRDTFDGLVLYGYNESTTPRILELAKELKYRAVLLAVWDLRSYAEIDGVVHEARLYDRDFALGVLLGNEGLTFGRYERDDLILAERRGRASLPRGIPLATSEPLVGYREEFVREFGDFLAPNIHPVFDAKQLDAPAAAAWAREQALKLSQQTGKPILLKETGFPHDGDAKYTPASQASFWKAYLAPGLRIDTPAKPHAWIYHGVAFEAFDLPWKAEASGLPIEKSWGLFSVDRKAYPALENWRDAKQK